MKNYLKLIINNIKYRNHLIFYNNKIILNNKYLKIKYIIYSSNNNIYLKI